MCEKWGEVCHTDLKEGEGLLIFMPENKHEACDWGGSAAVWRARNEVGHMAYGGGAFSAVEGRQPLRHGYAVTPPLTQGRLSPSVTARGRDSSLIRGSLWCGGVRGERGDVGIVPYGCGIVGNNWRFGSSEPLSRHARWRQLPLISKGSLGCDGNVDI